MPRKELSLDQVAYLLNNYKEQTAIELSVGMKVSVTKVKSELDKLGITAVVKQDRPKRRFTCVRERSKYISGLQPKPERNWVRPPTVYDNDKNRFLYKEIREMI